MSQIMRTIPKKVMEKIAGNTCKHYCIVTKGGKIISTGYNRDCGFTHNGNDYRSHAECEALKKVPKKYYAKVAKGRHISH